MVRLAAVLGPESQEDTCRAACLAGWVVEFQAWGAWHHQRWASLAEREAPGQQECERVAGAAEGGHGGVQPHVGHLRSQAGLG